MTATQHIIILSLDGGCGMTQKHDTFSHIRWVDLKNMAVKTYNAINQRPNCFWIFSGRICSETLWFQWRNTQKYHILVYFWGAFPGEIMCFDPNSTWNGDKTTCTVTKAVYRFTNVFKLISRHFLVFYGGSCEHCYSESHLMRVSHLRREAMFGGIWTPVIRVYHTISDINHFIGHLWSHRQHITSLWLFSNFCGTTNFV